jgi:hypothetical protein
MNPISGETFHTVSPFLVMVRPFKLLSNPAVYFAMLTQGMVAAWAIVCNLLTSQLFSPPPYNYTPAQVGYLNTGAIVGAIIAEFIGIALNDKIAKWWARRNNGIFERKASQYEFHDSSDAHILTLCSRVSSLGHLAVVRYRRHRLLWIWTSHR